MLRLTRSLITRALYSTQEKKNVVVIPKRYEVTHNQFQDVDSQILTAPNCKTLAVLVKVFPPQCRKICSCLLTDTSPISLNI